MYNQAITEAYLGQGAAERQAAQLIKEAREALRAACKAAGWVMVEYSPWKERDREYWVAPEFEELLRLELSDSLPDESEGVPEHLHIEVLATRVSWV